MPRVTFLPDGISVDAREGESLLEAARRYDATVGSACGGNLACSTCHLWVKKGLSSLSDIEEGEEDILDKAFDVRPVSRLGCQAKVSGDEIEAEITRESRQAYYDEHPAARPPA